jgi:hypothetical protein
MPGRWPRKDVAYKLIALQHILQKSFVDQWKTTHILGFQKKSDKL